MLLNIDNRTLLRGMLASAVAFASVSACSRPDRADAGRDTVQTGAAVTPADTTRPDTAVSVTPSDTASTELAGAAADTSRGHDTVAVGDSAQVGKPGERIEESETDRQAKADTLATGESDRVRPPEDSTETFGQVTTDSAEMAGAADTGAADLGALPDTAAAGYEPMARDTSVALAQGDTGLQVQSDTAVAAETDTAAIQVQPDTSTEAQTELAVEDQPDTVPDTVTVVGDTSSVDKPGPRAKEDTVALKADSLAKYHEADRVRPPEDSSETLGQVTTDQPNYDVEAVGDAEGDVAGAAPVPSTGNIATGADAVALMTREGQPCRVEDSPDVQWDLASSPATLNPCGSGTMTLPKVQTGEGE
jgi:hypothetical protein